MKSIQRKSVLCSLAIVLGLGLTWGSSSAFAVVRVGTLCTLKGELETKLIGRGLVIGLNGSGDGAGNAVAVQSLATVLRRLNTNIPAEAIKNADNVAYVLLEATVPASGLTKGQKVDVHVSSPFGAESLRGGRLLVSPMEDTNLDNLALYGLAGGAISIEDAETPTSGKVENGLTLSRDISPQVENDGKITLILRESNISYGTADKIAEAIFKEVFDGVDETEKSKWVKFDNRTITVMVSKAYQDDISSFISELQKVPVDNPRPQAIVRVNPRTNDIVISGAVEISPTIISLGGEIRVEIGQQNAGGNSLLDLDSPNAEEKLPQLSELKLILDNLQVSPKDKVNIIRMLNDTGKLHAVYIEE